MTASGFCENIIHCSLYALLSHNMLEVAMYNGSSTGNVAISSNFLLHSSMLGPSDCSKVLRTASNFSSRSPSLFSFGTSFLVKTFLLMMKGLLEIQALYLCV